ncbi:MAG: type II toxin-antitoxin system RelE/ParE family toxin [Ignavibacteria bacterium]|nr:type II toxin-antitoxin system RelE/ParE family toxin [Ignavibacteria bacterium]
MEKNLQLLASNPHLGRIPNDDEPVRLGYRYLVVENYLMFYAIEPKTILRHRILHGDQDCLNLSYISLQCLAVDVCEHI